MKRFFATVTAILLALLFAVSAAAETFYLAYPEDTGLSFVLEENKLRLRNIPATEENRFLWLCLAQDGEDVYSQIREYDGKTEPAFSLGKLSDGQYDVVLYHNTERYGTFASYLYGAVEIVVEGGVYSFAMSPAYEQNRRLAVAAEGDTVSHFLALSTNDPVMQQMITDLACGITRDANTDWERLSAIHDWVATYLYYDYDYLFGKSDTTQHDTADVLQSRKAVCHGFSSVTRDLVRALGIPCRQVFGYALGIGSEHLDADTWMQKTEANHVWVEAYIDGRWVAMDPTWDSANRYQNGTYETKPMGTRLYFDASPEMLAFDRKILSYESSTDVRLDSITPVVYGEDWNIGDGMDLPETLTVYVEGKATEVAAQWSHQTAEFCHSNVLRIDGYVRLSNDFYNTYGYNRIRTAIYCVIGQMPDRAEGYDWLEPWLVAGSVVKSEPERLLVPHRETLLRTNEVDVTWQITVFFGVLFLCAGILPMLYRKENEEQ